MTPINTVKETLPEDILAALGARYVDIEFLAAGANGAVFRAHDQNLDKKVAIKVLKSSSARDLIAFQKEARSAAKLEHINLVSILNFGITASNNAYIILEFVDGLSLERFVESNGHLSVTQSMDLLRQVMTGLSHAHSKNIAHRDLKTSNIMVYGFGTSSLKAVVIDFGLACDQKLQDESQVATNALFGSPLYMSPEQAGGSKGDRRSDIYSLGCIAYRMVTGHTPFFSDDLFTVLHMHREQRPPLLTELAPDLEFPEGLQECLDIMLEKDPDDRFQSIEEILDRFDKIEQTQKKKEEEHLALQLEAQRAAQKASAPPLEIKSFKKKWLAIPIISILVLTGLLMVAARLQASHLPAPAVVPVAEEAKTIFEKRGTRNSEDFVKVWRVERASILEEHEWEQIIPRSAASITDSSLRLIAQEKVLKASNLNLSASMIDGTGLKYLKNVNIEVLDLADCKLSPAGYEALSQMKSIQKLSLCRTAVGERDLKLIAKLPRLTDLLLVNCKNVDDKCMDTIVQMKRIALLNISNTGVTNKGLENISKMKNLESIVLRYDKITDSGALQLLGCEKLNEFNVEGCKQITGKTLKGLTEKFKSQLTKIGIAFTNTKKEDLVYLKNCPGITELSVAGIPVTDKELKLISNFSRMLDLYFSNAKFTDAELIKTVAALPRLEALGAVRCNVKNETLRILRKDPKTGKERKLAVITGEDQMDGFPDYAKVTFDMILSENDEIGSSKPQPKSLLPDLD